MKIAMLLIGAFISPFLAGVLVGFGLAVRCYGKASSSGARAVEISKTQQVAGEGWIVDPGGVFRKLDPKERERLGGRKFCARRAG